MRALYLMLGLAGCTSDITMTDDIDLTWDFEVTFKRFEGNLHTPYVKGTPVRLYVWGGEDDDLRGWKIYSSDSSVFEIDGYQTDDDTHGLTAVGRAVGEGIAGLIVDDAHANQVGAGAAEVYAPDRAVLEAHGYLIIDREQQARVDDLRILAGGTATYLVRYFRGDMELHGNSVLSVDPVSGVSSNPRTSWLFENREWLSVSPTAVGNQNITLRADGDMVGTLPVVMVPETDIARVELLGQSAKGHDDGDWLVLLAQAYDAVDRRIFGVDFAWEIEGAMQTESGDLYRYSFKEDDYKTVTAERFGHSATTEIQSDRGYVDSSNNIGCNAGGGGLLAAFGLLGLRRRRRR